MFTNDLGFNIKKYRKIHNMSQEDLSFILHVTHQTISRYENGLLVPSIEIICEIADVFDVSIDELVGRKRLESKVKNHDKIEVQKCINKL